MQRSLILTLGFAVLISISTCTAQDIGSLLGIDDVCASSPCFEEVGMPAQCCEATYLYTIAQGVSSGLAMLSNDTSIICSNTCRDIVLGPFRRCLSKKYGNETMDSVLASDFCSVDCLFDDPELNIEQRDVYDCAVLEDIPVDCRYNVSSNSKVGPLFTTAFRNCGFQEDEYKQPTNAGFQAVGGIALSGALGAAALLLMNLLA